MSERCGNALQSLKIAWSGKPKTTIKFGRNKLCKGKTLQGLLLKYLAATKPQMYVVYRIVAIWSKDSLINPSVPRQKWFFGKGKGINAMKQMLLASSGFEKYGLATKRSVFLMEMDRVVPWSALYELVEQVYPQHEVGCPPIGGGADVADSFPAGVVKPVGTSS